MLKKLRLTCTTESESSLKRVSALLKCLNAANEELDKKIRIVQNCQDEKNLTIRDFSFHRKIGLGGNGSVFLATQNRNVHDAESPQSVESKKESSSHPSSSSGSSSSHYKSPYYAIKVIKKPNGADVSQLKEQEAEKRIFIINIKEKS